MQDEVTVITCFPTTDTVSTITKKYNPTSIHCLFRIHFYTRSTITRNVSCPPHSPELHKPPSWPWNHHMAHHQLFSVFTFANNTLPQTSCLLPRLPGSACSSAGRSLNQQSTPTGAPHTCLGSLFSFIYIFKVW